MNKNELQQTMSPPNGATFSHDSDFTSSPQSYEEAASYAAAQFPSDFVSADSSNGMPYPGFPSQYMPMPYGYMPYEYNYDYGSYYRGRRSYKPYKKHYNSGYMTTQKIYTKKPKQPQQVTDDAATNGVANNSAKLEGTPDIDKLPHHITNAKFFVIKSYSEEDVHKAIKHNVWCSTREGNVKLHDAYVTANGEYPIYLLFSVNSSGYFVGVAQMKSHVDFEKSFEGWDQFHKWKGVFKLSWIYIKDVPNKELRHLTNDLNEGKAVTHSRDCQEVPFEVGVKVLEIFEKFKNETSILDDFEYYEMQEKSRV